jgi:glycine cleavage system H protein
MQPEQLLYAKSHEWAAVETNDVGEKVVTLGLSKFALDALTDLVFVELFEPGQTIEAGERFGEIESVKTVSDLYSPVAGEIIERNDDVADDLDAISNDPYGAGWLVKVKVADEAGLAALVNFDAYQIQCAEEQH